MMSIRSVLKELMETSDVLQEFLHGCLFETVDSIAVERFKNALKNELDFAYEVDDFEVHCAKTTPETTEFVAFSPSLNLTGKVLVTVNPQLSFE